MSVRTLSGLGRTLEIGADIRGYLSGGIFRMVVAHRRGIVVCAEAPLVAAGGLEGVLGAARARRVAHGRGGRALFVLLVPPYGATGALGLDLLGVLVEELAHELREIRFVHAYLLSSGTHGRFSGPT